MLAKITVDSFEMKKDITGECISSELIWTENVKCLHHIKNGQYPPRHQRPPHIIHYRNLALFL